MNNNLAVSLFVKILPVCHTKHPYQYYVFLWLASFFFLQFRCQQFSSLHLTGEKSGQSSYGPEPNPDMCAVSAMIQLMFGQEYGRANLLLLPLKSDFCSLQSQHQNLTLCRNKSVSTEERKHWKIMSKLWWKLSP